MIGIVKAAARGFFRAFGLDLVRHNPATSIELGLPLMFRRHAITLVLDVGASKGQYARRIRKAGYRGKIVSFEPLSGAFARLQKRVSSDPSWECVRAALGSTDGTGKIHVSGNLVSSSLLPISDRSIAAAASSAYVGNEAVRIARLDSLWPELVRDHDRVFLKLDVQGYEMEVLKGATESLPLIAGVQVELSLVPLYRGQPLFCEMFQHLHSAGFEVVAIDRGFSDRLTGEVLQVDGVFFRRSPHRASD